MVGVRWAYHLEAHGGDHDPGLVPLTGAVSPQDKLIGSPHGKIFMIAST